MRVELRARLIVAVAAGETHDTPAHCAWRRMFLGEPATRAYIVSAKPPAAEWADVHVVLRWAPDRPSRCATGEHRVASCFAVHAVDGAPSRPSYETATHTTAESACIGSRAGRAGVARARLGRCARRWRAVLALAARPTARTTNVSSRTLPVGARATIGAWHQRAQLVHAPRHDSTDRRTAASTDPKRTDVPVRRKHRTATCRSSAHTARRVVVSRPR